MVERCVAIPGGRCQLFVAASEFDEDVILAVGDNEPFPGELQQGRRVAVPFEADPPIGGNRAQSAQLLVAERDLPALEDRNRNERAVVLRTQEEVSRAPDVRRPARISRRCGGR